MASTCRGIGRILLLITPVFCIKQNKTQESSIAHSQPDNGSNKVDNYRNVLQLGDRPYITFTVKSDENAHVMLAEKNIDYEDLNTYTQFGYKMVKVIHTCI